MTIEPHQPSDTPIPIAPLRKLTDWFDHVFVINCKHRPDRLAEFTEEMQGKGLADMDKVTIVPAVIGDYTLHPAGWGGGRGAWGCVLPGNRVQGRIHTASKAWYSGDAVEIVTRTGKTTTLTINHPVLTKHGFVAAGQLCQGQHLVCYNARVQSSPSGNHVNHRPPTVGEVFDALVSEGHAPFRKRRTGLDFYGDGEFLKGDVEIVDINRPLLSTMRPFGQQSAVEHPFLRGHSHVQGGLPHARPRQLTLPHMRPPQRHVFSLVPPPLADVFNAAQHHVVTQQQAAYTGTIRVTTADNMPGVVGELVGERVDSFAGLVALHDRFFICDTQMLGVGQSSGSLGVAQVDAARGESSADGVTVGIEDSGYGGDRDARRVVSDHPIHFFMSESGRRLRAQGIGAAAELDARFSKPAFDDVHAETQLAGDLTGRFAGAVEFDDVVDVRFFHYEGEVFDFGTSVGYFTTASEEVNDESGIIVSNCLQSHRRIMEDLMHLRDEREALTWERALILEDDVFFLDGALDDLAKFMANVPEDWGQIYLGGQHRRPIGKTKHPEVVIGRSVNRTHAYAISKSHIQKIYAHVSYMADYHGTKKHIDHQLEVAHQRADWPVYCPAKWICGQRASTSNVSGKKLEAMTWQ